jgi:hypothetical protein
MMGERSGGVIVAEEEAAANRRREEELLMDGAGTRPAMGYEGACPGAYPPPGVTEVIVQPGDTGYPGGCPPGTGYPGAGYGAGYPPGGAYPPAGYPPY